MFALTLPESTAILFLVLTLPFCAWAAVSDLRHMKIRNPAVLGLFGIFLLTGPFVMPLPSYGWHLGAAVIVLAAGFLLNLIGAMGAGDAKFIAAAAPFIMPGDALSVLYLFSAVLLVVFLLHRAARAIPALRQATPDWASWAARKFPLGLALGPSLSLYFGLAAIG